MALATNAPSTTNATQAASTASACTQPDPFIARRFASIYELSQWLPNVKKREGVRHCGISLSSRNRVLAAQVVLIFTVLACNIALTVFAMSRYPSDDVVGIIYDGDCDTVGNLNTWLHLLINVLSMGMLSGK